MTAIRTFIATVQSMRGLWGFLIAVTFGALGVLGQAPFHFWPVFALSISGLLILLDGAATRPKPILSGFGIAWSWAFGYFLAGMFWVGNAFLVDAEKFALLMPFAVTALPALLAMCWGFGGALVLAFWRSDASRVVVFAVALSLAEFARGHILTGLPWNLPAYIWQPGNIISQTSALIGPYGLSLLTLFVLASPAGIVLSQNKAFGKTIGTCAVAVAIGAFAFGAIRLNGAGVVNPMAGSGPIISAGQAGFTQKEVWESANSLRVTQSYLDLLDHPKARQADVVVWPEGTFPFMLQEQPEVLAALDARLGDRTLALGSIRRTRSGQGDTYFNSLFVLDRSQGSLALSAVYDKYHLVPFGEYLPFRSIFQAMGIASLVSYEGEMTPGPAPATLNVRGAPVADPRICYEIVFPHFNPAALNKAGWILNVSVDAWYGDLLGPDQHYAKARARAIETGMPVVRAASGGWSAIIDRYGRPLDQHRAGAGYASARLPLNAQSTFYSRHGDMMFLFMAGILGVIIGLTRKKY